MKNGHRKLWGTLLLSTALVTSTVSTTLVGVNEAQAKTETSKKKPSKKPSSGKYSSLKTNDPFGKTSKVTHKGLSVYGTNALEQYIAYNMYKGVTKISLKKYQKTKKVVSIQYALNNVKEMNQTLFGVKSVKVSRTGKNKVPDYMYVSYVQSKTITDLQYASVYKGVKKFVSDSKKFKTVDEKYDYLYNYIATKTRTNNYTTNKTKGGTVFTSTSQRIQYAKDSSIWGAMVQKSANSKSIAQTYKYLAQQIGLKSNVVKARKSESIVYLNTQVYKGNYIVATDMSKGVLSTGVEGYATGMSLSQLQNLGYYDIQINDPIQYNASSKEYYTSRGLVVSTVQGLENLIMRKLGTTGTVVKTPIFVRGGISGEVIKELEIRMSRVYNGTFDINVATLTQPYLKLGVKRTIKKPVVNKTKERVE